MNSSKRNTLTEFAGDLGAADVGASPLVGRVAFFRQDLRGARRKIEVRLGVSNEADPRTRRVL